VAAWTAARHEGEAALREVASAAVTAKLLSGGVPADLRLRGIRLLDLREQTNPPTVRVHVKLRTDLAGDRPLHTLPAWFPRIRRTRRLYWTLALTEDEACPWQVRSSI